MSDEVNISDPKPEPVSNNYSSAYSMSRQVSVLFRIRNLFARPIPMSSGNCGTQTFPYPVGVNRRPIRISNVHFVLLCWTVLVSSQEVKDSPLPAAQER